MKLSNPTIGSTAWRRRLLGSHEPEPGLYSICMHRPDAETVSYTQIDVAENQGLPALPAGSALSSSRQRIPS